MCEANQQQKRTLSQSRVSPDVWCFPRDIELHTRYIRTHPVATQKYGVLKAHAHWVSFQNRHLVEHQPFRWYQPKNLLVWSGLQGMDIHIIIFASANRTILHSANTRPTFEGGRVFVDGFDIDTTTLSSPGERLTHHRALANDLAICGSHIKRAKLYTSIC